MLLIWLWDRLQFEFEQDEQDEENDDWFINDEKSPESVKRDEEIDEEDSHTIATDQFTHKSVEQDNSSKRNQQASSSSQVQVQQQQQQQQHATNKTSFLYFLPAQETLFVMELCTNETNGKEKRYGSKYFRIFLPHIYQDQADFLLFARKRLQKSKIRFSFDEFSMSKWNNPAYGGKLVYSLSTDKTNSNPNPNTDNTKTSRHFKLVTPKLCFSKVEFEIQKAERKQEITLQIDEDSFNLKNLLGNLLSLKTSKISKKSSKGKEKEKYHSLIQKFINPIVDMKCTKTNDTILRIEKEGVSVLSVWLP